MPDHPMPDHADLTDQTDAVPTEALQRRHFMRGGALLAGAAAGAVVVSAASALPAAAANGDPVTVGGNVTGTATTTLNVNAAAVPTLSLKNTLGPTLSLTAQPRTFDPTLRVGEIVNTVDGPLIGVDDGAGGAVATIIATGSDLAVLPVPLALPPERLIDTRPGNSRANVLASSAAAFDANGRLKAGKCMDIAVEPANGDYTDDAAFLNVTSTGSLAAGFLLVYPPVDTRPNASTLNFTKGATVANAAFVALGVVAGNFAVRVYASADSHVIIDLNGVVSTAVPGPAATTATAMRTRQATRLRSSRRVQRSYSRR